MLLHLSDKSHIAAKYARHWFLKNSVFFELSWKYGALSSRTKLRLLQPLAWEKYSYRERELFFFAVKKTAGAPQLRKALPVKAMWSEQQSCVFPSLCASRVKELHIKSWQESVCLQNRHLTTQPKDSKTHGSLSSAEDVPVPPLEGDNYFFISPYWWCNRSTPNTSCHPKLYMGRAHIPPNQLSAVARKSMQVWIYN